MPSNGPLCCLMTGQQWCSQDQQTKHIQAQAVHGQYNTMTYLGYGRPLAVRFDSFSHSWVVLLIQHIYYFIICACLIQHSEHLEGEATLRLCASALDESNNLHSKGMHPCGIQHKFAYRGHCICKCLASLHTYKSMTRQQKCGPAACIALLMQTCCDDGQLGIQHMNAPRACTGIHRCTPCWT
jgi:hypothetical protein